jgi:RNA polymerase sigma-54 factor
MAMEARLSLRQSQRVVMTPLLQQAIQLLQLSTLELKEVVQKELLENPMLEEVTPDTPETAADAPATADTPPAPTVEPLTPETPPTTERQTDELPFDFNAVMSAADDDHEERSLVSQEDREDLPFENVVRTQVSLADHLEEQLRWASEDGIVRRIGAEIIGNLDEDGYLRAELEEIAQRCGVSAEDVAKVVELVQGFDPPGVAARSIQECLLLQLRRDPLPDPVSVEIIEVYFDDLSRRRYQDIARAMKLPVDRIMESVEEIMGLEPKPGRRFGGNDSRYIVPDVFVYKHGTEYTIVLNEDGIPRLRVNALYRSLLRGAGSGDEAKQYVEQKLRSALWLIKSVDQRQRTLRKVTQSIVKFQRDFLDRGLPHLRPLSLRDVGEDIGMHESTISRVTTNKYVETPQGLFELKFFFHSGIASGDGEMVSSVSVKKMIQDLLAAEDPAKPQSDQEVAQALQKRGLTIARRTVAKYREELGILPSHQRRLAPRKR